MTFEMQKPEPKNGYDSILLGLIYDLAQSVSLRATLEEDDRDPALQKFVADQERALLKALRGLAS